MVVGDLNADTSDLPSLQAYLDTAEFIDIGAHPSHNNSTITPTCYPPNHVTPHRRDYIIVSAGLYSGLSQLSKDTDYSLPPFGSFANFGTPFIKSLPLYQSTVVHHHGSNTHTLHITQTSHLKQMR
eukprot:2231844-Karenia_brevis.AAC.1